MVLEKISFSLSAAGEKPKSRVKRLSAERRVLGPTQPRAQRMTPGGLKFAQQQDARRRKRR